MSEYGEVLIALTVPMDGRSKKLRSFLYFLFEACRTQAPQYSISLKGAYFSCFRFVYAYMHLSCMHCP